MMKYIKIMIILAGIWMNAGCESWLDVQPVDQVSEEQLFETKSGFMQALNGVYVEMNQSALYGEELLFKTVEILAQRYQFSSAYEQSKYYELSKFNYTSDYAEEVAANIWKEAYALILNLNKIIENAELKKELFTEEHYDWLTGEAYALRAFLHFDLLRLFGPVYVTDSDKLSICYNTHYALSASDLLPASEVVEKVITDLQEAERRLQTDPIIEQGPLSSDAGTDSENYWRYRSLRMNYYAVKALQARVWLYAGENEKACEAARVVTKVQEKYFPFTEYTSVVGNTKTPDRVFSSELLFALQNTKRNDIFTAYFSPDLSDYQIFKTSKTFLEDVFGVLRDKDMRYSPIWLEATNYDFRCFYKYAKVENTNLYNYLIPLIRVTEMYYILAEASTDKTEALNSINIVLETRGLNKLESETLLQETLLSEYQKEFWGEGQLFFYYKRLNKSSISSAIGQSVAMETINYQMPLPQIETDYR